MVISYFIIWALQNMMLTLFFLNLIFLVPYIPASKSASLEHNCHIFRTQLPHLSNKTVTSLGCNMLAAWWGVWLQHCDHSNYNTLMRRFEQLSLRLGWKFIKGENGSSIVGLLGNIPVTLLWPLRTPFKQLFQCMIGIPVTRQYLLSALLVRDYVVAQRQEKIILPTCLVSFNWIKCYGRSQKHPYHESCDQRLLNLEISLDLAHDPPTP